MVLKIGSTGESVKILQRHLKLKDDGIFGKKTEVAVKDFQKKNGLVPDGLVGQKTWSVLNQIISTDGFENSYEIFGRSIIKHHLRNTEYVREITKKDNLFLHHTAGWNNPFDQIDGWNNDDRGKIGTEFVIGGTSIRKDKTYDGIIAQAFPEGYYAWHLGSMGKLRVHTHSVGIELCSFGHLDSNKKTYTGQTVSASEVCTLKNNFRGHKYFHKYSNDQLKSLKLLIKHIADRDNINVRDGLPALIKKSGLSAFDFNSNAFNGLKMGLWSHTNVRKDKLDVFPQPELIDMLIEL